MQKILTHFSENRKLYLLGGVALLSFMAVYLFQDSTHYVAFQDFASKHKVIIFFIMILMKIVAIVWPPFPAMILFIGLLPILGFWTVFLADYIGELIGSTIAYYIAYHYGYDGIKHFLDDKSIRKIEKIKIKKEKELEFLLVLRVLGNNFFEIMCYGAGLLKISFKSFILSTIISYFFISLITFKLIEGLFSESSFFISAVLLAILLVYISKFSNRYFESHS